MLFWEPKNPLPIDEIIAKRKAGYTLIVETLKSEHISNKLHLEEGARGRIVKAEKEKYHPVATFVIYVEWIPNLYVDYRDVPAINGMRSSDNLELKQAIPPGNPSQLELSLEPEYIDLSHDRAA